MADIDDISQESSQTVTKKSKKKRKRETEKSTDQPPSTSAELTEQQSVDVKVEAIYDRADRSAPIVGYFPSGYKPQKNEENLSPQQSTVRFYRSTRAKMEKSSSEKDEKRRTSERLELVVSPHWSNVDFVGKSYKGEAMAAQLCTYALGVFDKMTQTLKIVPIAGNKIFRLEPKVRGLDTADEEPSVLENEPSGENRTDKRRELAVLYGTKRSIAGDKKLQALRQGDNPESQEDLGNKIDNIVVNKEALASTSAQVARNIPPYNSSATTPQEAYPLNGIILAGEWDFLEDVYEILKTGAGVSSNAYPTFVRNRIHKLQEIQDEVEKKTLSRIFSYITHLIKFKDMHSLDGAASAKNHRFPSILRQKFMNMFTPGSRTLPIEKIDLLISYVLVLTLYVDDFRSNPTDIAKDLRMSPVDLRVHFENLGCKGVNENKSFVATLPVPLKFQTVKRGRGRPRKR
ncbi:hypothetical protein JCGZ_24735 [Jatropha curcas]|uniref:DNA-directed RNA polymerase I subunit rpa49 n=2 Tax=Jatropha curcas TaxID=180498 RepID=A0A067KX36_JATCU|nr:DNA-directed RNA polymerase I subunit rpa49 isoform X2 [Jatropha curcas]KDP40736.1 hypothetical protein JCGZ_24735 [Jatropha curcas]